MGWPPMCSLTSSQQTRGKMRRFPPIVAVVLPKVSKTECFRATLPARLPAGQPKRRSLLEALAPVGNMAAMLTGPRWKLGRAAGIFGAGLRDRASFTSSCPGTRGAGPVWCDSWGFPAMRLNKSSISASRRSYWWWKDLLFIMKTDLPLFWVKRVFLLDAMGSNQIELRAVNQSIDQ